jgi:hypothetical protein
LSVSLRPVPACNQLTKIQIQALARGLVNEYISELGPLALEEMWLDLNGLYESVIYPKYELALRSDMDLGEIDSAKVLGKTLTSDRLILIDRAISPPNRDARYSFTAGHEIGHGVLHRDRAVLFRDTKDSLFGPDGRDRYEVEANWFAAELLMPDWLVKRQFVNCYRPSRPLHYAGPGAYTLDVFGHCDRVRVGSLGEYCRAVARPLQVFFFGVSKTALGLRLFNLGFILNTTHEKLIINEPPPRPSTFSNCVDGILAGCLQDTSQT